jgi:hypothetical protein
MLGGAMKQVYKYNYEDHVAIYAFDQRAEYHHSQVLIKSRVLR